MDFLRGIGKNIFGNCQKIFLGFDKNIFGNKQKYFMFANIWPYPPKSYDSAAHLITLSEALPIESSKPPTALHCIAFLLNEVNWLRPKRSTVGPLHIEIKRAPKWSGQASKLQCTNLNRDVLCAMYSSNLIQCSGVFCSDALQAGARCCNFALWMGCRESLYSGEIYSGEIGMNHVQGNHI